MKCPECQFENKPDAELCEHCGVRLGVLPHISSSSSRFEEEMPRRDRERSLAGSKASVAGGYGTRYLPLQIETEISPRTKMLIFSAVFYALLLSYLCVALVSPSNPYAQLATVFQSFWANFFLLVLFLVAATFCVYAAACFCCKRMLKSEWGKPKLGKLMLREGYVTKEDIEKALEEQQMERRVGEILQERGILKEDDIEWLLGQQEFGRRYL